ncbi:MAG: hypothetical protein ABIJ25_10525 [Pseudomonadota bacterium]
MMQAVVIDTNVLTVANGKSDHAGRDCFLNCIKALERAQKKQMIIIDSGMRIINEYQRYSSRAGQPGIGDAFFKWLFYNQCNSLRCKQVDITPLKDDADNFEEFPSDPELIRFDRSDRKFVAVAVTSRLNPTILNATDTDWWYFREILERHKISIVFLCPELMA